MAVQNLSEKDFGAVEKSETPVLIDFYATWCGPCRMLSPVLDEISEAYTGKIAFYRVDTDESPALASRYGIEYIPTLVLLQSGDELRRISGYHNKTELDAFLSGNP